MMMMNYYDHTKNRDIACERILTRQTIEEGRNELGFCTARDESMGCCCFLGVLYADDVRFHSCHPYIERLPTL